MVATYSSQYRILRRDASLGYWEVPISAWNYHGPPTDTDLIQISLLFLLEKGKIKLFICSILFLSGRLSPGIWMVRSYMFLLPNF